MPWHLLKQRQQGSHENARPRGTTQGEDRGSRLFHVGKLGPIAGELQGVVRLDRAAQIRGPAVIQRPPAIVGLTAAQVRGDLALEHFVDLVHEVHHQHVIGGDAGIRFQIKPPEPLTVLQPEQSLFRPLNGEVCGGGAALKCDP